MYFSTGSQLSTALASLSASKVGQFLAFDALYYSNTYMLNGNTTALTPIEHFVQYGAAAMAKPNATFDPVYYKQHYADLAGTNLNSADLLYHFMQFGLDEGRLPNATLAATFNSTAYLAAYPDVAAYVNANLAAFGGSASNGALAHYVKFGAAQGFTLPTGPAAATTFNMADSTTAGLKTMMLTGDQDVRIDFTNNPNTVSQITGLDLNGNGAIANDGVENALGVKVALGYKAVDAYTRLVDGVVNEKDLSKVFLGDIAYDGTGFAGDGVKTNGNVVLGGLGADTILGGIGNDFLAGGGVALSRGAGTDKLSGGRNADFLFAELSLLSNTDGNHLFIDGGSTADDNSAASTTSAQDSDWLLLQASDDDEPVTVNLTENTGTVGTTPVNDGTLNTRADQWATLRDIENVDASGNTYGFLKGVGTAVGGAPTGAANPDNNGIGSSGQLRLNGSDVANILIGGYDNDVVNGNAGADLLMGGNLTKLIDPNLVGLVGGTDGIDNLQGGAGNDNIAFETDTGIIDGGADADTLWLTAKTLGNNTAAAVLADGRIRIDLTASTLASAAGYGGADVDGTQDQTKYATNAGTGRVTMTNMESVIATGLGAVDYKAAGANTATDLTFTNQQNFLGYAGNMDLRGTNGVATTTAASTELTFTTAGGIVTTATFAGTLTLAQAFAQLVATNPGIAAGATAPAVVVTAGTTTTAGGSNTLYAYTGKDLIEGRAGDDFLSGGEGDDDFVFQISGTFGTASGDGVDVIHRQLDANADNIWDTGFGQDFGQVSVAVTANSKLTLTLTDTANPASLTGFPVNGVVISLGGVVYSVALTSGVQGTYAAFTAGLNAALDANPALAALDAVLNTNNTITITDPAGKTFAVVPNVTGYTFVNNVVPSAGSLVWTTAVGDPSVSQTQDRLIFAAYEDRADGELVDDNGMVNSTGDAVTLGTDGYAEDLVVRFGSSGSNTQGVSTIGDTIVAEDQFWNVVFTNLADEDTVSVTVNGTAFALQMGVAPDGTAIAETDAGFIARLRTLINTSADKDTLAGELLAAGAGTTLTLTQVAYNGGQNVYMDRPVVALGNGSGGEPASVAINKTGTNSEITLADYDGRNAGLTAKNVLFVGGSGMNEGALINEGLNTETMTSITGLANTNSRSVLATALAAGGTLNGSNALVLDSMTDVDTIATDFSLHGDDYLIGGVGSDTMVGGTGDDRFEGSKAPTTGGDVINGGKDLYVVRTQDGAAVVETVETLNTYEASVRRDTTVAANANVLNVLYLEEDTAAGATDGFLDTLVFNRNNFDATTNFYITVGRAGDTNLLQQRAGGEGTVLAGTNITATATAAPDAGTTAFTEMEAIRTLSGNGTHAGQGKDTVDLSLVSNAVVASYATAAAAEANAALVTYNLTTALGVIGLHFDGDANDTNNVAADNIANFLSVDGVENVVGGAANDLVNIDQAEVLKDNTFVGNGQTSLASSTTVAGVNGDRIVYDHSGLTAANRPFLTVTIEGTTNTDTVAMKGGVVGNDATTDTLIGVETITLADAAQGLERDTLVTSSVAGGVVNFQIGKVLTTGSGATLVDIVDMTQLENVVASTGADTIVVGNTMTNSLSLAASVAAVNNNGFTFFGATTLNSIQLSNQGLYSFDFTGAATTAVGDTASDTIDYRAEGNQDIAVVLDLVNTGINSIDRVVVASTDIDVAANLSAVGARVDVLRGADRFFAGSGDAGNDSVIDLSQHAVASDITVTFSANVVPNNNERLIDIRVSGSSIAKQMIDDGVTALERTGGSTPAELVLNPVGVQAAEEAYWNRIQGNAGNETINLTDYVSGHAMAFNLGAGANVVNYNPATIGTSLNMANVAGNATSQTFTITTTDNFAASATHTATGSVGSVRVQGSSVGTDYINLSALNAAISYTVDLKIAEGSGVIGNIIAAAVDVNADGDTTDAGDFKAFTTVVSGYENISGNNAANTYILNTAVNNVYMGNGNDTLTVTLAEDLAGDTIVGDSQGGLAATQAAVVGGTLAAGNMDDGSDTIKFTGNLTDGTYTFVLGNGTVDQFTLGAGSSSAMYGFENIDASGATDTNDVFVLTASTVGGPVPLSSILRGGAGNDTLTAGASITSTILDGGAGADTIAMGAFTGVVAQYEFGDSNSASKDTVTGFTTTVDAFEIKVDMAARGMTNVSGSFATGATGSRVLTSGIASSFYDTTLTQLQVDMNADGINDATGDLTITSAGAVAAGDVRYTITGTDAANVISGGSGNDTILGGAGNDTLSGGAGSSLVMSFELVGVVTGAGGNVTIGGQVVVAATGVGPDTVGAAFAAISPATYALGFVTGTAPTAVSYNAGTNQLSFTFAVDESASVTFADIAVAAGAAGFSVAAPTLVTPFLAVGGGVDTITGGAGADTMTGGALGDVFAYGTLATASAQTGITLATADTITDFATGVDTIKMGTAGGANYTEVAAAASFAAATTAANVWFAAGIGARAYYLTDTVADGGLLFIDSNLDGTADALIKLTGVTSASFAATDIVA